MICEKEKRRGRIPWGSYEDNRKFLCLSCYGDVAVEILSLVEKSNNNQFAWVFRVLHVFGG
jgi:hypothetical protein